MRFVLLLVLMCSVGASFASKEALTPDQSVRYHALIAELRCLVCQNQNLSESNAPLAEDLKTQVANMIVDGRSDHEIKEYLIARYGDFVLYRPPFKPLTWLLWTGPFLLLLAGLFIASRLFKAADEGSTNVDGDAIESLLREQEEHNKADGR